jgi:hypothetical protein
VNIIESKIVQPEMFELVLPIHLSDFSTSRLIVDIAIFKAFANNITLDELYLDLISYSLYKCNRAVDSVEYTRNCTRAKFQYTVYKMYLFGRDGITDICNKTLWSIDECPGGMQLNLINEVSYGRR